jgi:hypothetical protein
MSFNIKVRVPKGIPDEWIQAGIAALERDVLPRFASLTPGQMDHAAMVSWLESAKRDGYPVDYSKFWDDDRLLELCCMVYWQIFSKWASRQKSMDPKAPLADFKPERDRRLTVAPVSSFTRKLREKRDEEKEQLSDPAAARAFLSGLRMMDKDGKDVSLDQVEVEGRGAVKFTEMTDAEACHYAKELLETLVRPSRRVAQEGMPN